jgi:hypothetical protein
MKDVALSVTQTEVKLSLPNQQTAHRTTFTIEGVVDIIRDNDRLVMWTKRLPKLSSSKERTCKY